MTKGATLMVDPEIRTALAPNLCDSDPDSMLEMNMPTVSGAR